MDNRKQSFKNDIEVAERNILIISWVGVVVTFAFIGYTITSLM